MAFVVEYIIFSYAYFVIACTLSLRIGAYWLSMSVTKEIRRILRSINRMAQIEKRQSKGLKLSLSEFIYSHATMIQLSSYFINLMFQKFILCNFDVN